MKNFDEFINENNETPKKYRYIDFLEITYYVTNILKDKLESIEVGNEGTTVTTANSGDDIPDIGKRKDYELEDGSYSHIIIGVRLFYGNSGFISNFNSMTEYGKHIISVEDKIKSLFTVEKISNIGDYFWYLIKITEDLSNMVDSKKGIDKYSL